MEYATHALVVITLLQLSRAEIQDQQSYQTWFSANTINDGYPKPLAELFPPDDPSFSPTKPIVVLPNLASFSPDESSSTPLPPISYTSSVSPSTPFSDTYSPSLDFSQTPVITSKWPTDTTASIQTTTAKPITTLQQSLPTSSLPHSSNPPNFFVLYQNEQNPIKNVPITQRSTDVTQTSIIVTHPISTSSSPLTSVSDGTITPYINTGTSVITSRPTVTFRSTPPTSSLPPISSTQTTILTKDCNSDTISSTPLPPGVVTGPPKIPSLPHLRIRVIAPKGSITNIKINPTTTTKMPTTKKTKKPKRNSYDGCLNACKGRKDPICAVPLASTIIDPKTLKGFPSICHMACHNSYKKDAYEKLIDGRCGRLRTRIISVDSQKKIQRDELKKTEYSVLNTGPKTVVEFAHAPNLEK
ncbi:hypothetical protein ACJJTC_019741 [Scirpophaga incertulas]